MTGGEKLTTFDLSRSAIAGGVVLVIESARDGGHGRRSYSARIVKIAGRNVRAPQPYTLDARGHKRARPTLRHFTIEFEEI